MKGIDYARELLRLARADHRAMTGMRDQEVFTDAIFGFHAQQAVEKGLKAWLSALEILFPLTHDISRLLPLLEQQGVEMMDLWEWVELTPFAVEHRYAWGDDAEAPLDRINLITRIHGLLEHIDDQIRRVYP
ncbi:MAG: HEPN domain-containing protein [Magnetococcales bacterium]|nr:HEPN domain-containing protein [Magnetococcales bacterium]MBF0584059.1 HEPN domain-containing protein [Magnetococcales bacterium]